ncbi:MULTISPECIES: DnaJ domain-containing protein [Sphingosinicellaceae]|uniref:DnaJ domain-containing protein n=1 Tax=Sphingosinicellaceae TaxID=2820280 RepID=UPI001C1E249B|nr:MULTISPECIES: DnaJ domain-containing protein [Polymorphobacter]QYE35199.1 J domain-containing protein [Polymorphobacter sp. PAMC 29334]UAJ11475.1 J domain-containing protein [Polymorphobacter megasporae]
MTESGPDTPPPGTSRPRSPRFHGRVERAEPTPCARPGCPNPAEFRAPRSNRVAGEIGGWQWLCLDHVREFNAGYNFFDGMSPEAITAAQSPLAGWERAAHDPTVRFNDPLGMARDRYGPDVFAGRRAKSGHVLSDVDMKALKSLDLGVDASPADIRRAYKSLVRQYHPDANGGDRTHEGKLQAVVQAYTHLKSAPAFTRPR